MIPKVSIIRMMIIFKSSLAVYRCGGMEDATDLKSVGSNIVGVRAPPSVPIKTIGWVLGGNPSFVNQYKIKKYRNKIIRASH